MDAMSTDDRASLAVWLDVRDLGRMTRAARGWAEHSVRRQSELFERLAASPRHATATWAMVTRPSWPWHAPRHPELARFGPDTRTAWYFAVLELEGGPVTWLTRHYGAVIFARPGSDLRIHWIHEGRGPQGEWVDETTLERQWSSAEPTSDDDYDAAEDDDDDYWDGRMG